MIMFNILKFLYYFMANISVWSVLFITLMTMIWGAVWYGPLFGKQWGRMLGYSKLSQKEAESIKNEMWISLLWELSMVLTFYITLAYFIAITPHHSTTLIAFIIWIGIIVPTTTSVTLWSGIERNQIVPRILIMISFRFIMIMLAWLMLW